METELKLIRYSHSVGESNIHLEFTPKYRRKIFSDKDVKAMCEQEFRAVAKQLGVQLAGLGFGVDHVHLFITGWKNYSIAELVQRLKGASSRHIRQTYPVRLRIKGLYGDQLWSDGYFHRTVGAVTATAMKKYVNESQSKHWKIENQKQTQTTMLNYTQNN